jgi:CDP-paratose 2-epimerase
MKYFITGGCGFLGSNLASSVLKQKDELIVLDNLSRVGTDQNLLWLQSLGDFTFIQKDIRDTLSVEKIIKEHTPDVIFHLAGQVAMTTSIEDPRKDFEINSLGSLNVLEAVRKHSPLSKIIYSSTNKVYGDLEYLTYNEGDTRYHVEEYPNGIPEHTRLNFSSPYGCSKGAADQYMLDYHKVYGLQTLVFRHSSMYGGRQYSTYDQGWIGWFCEQAIKTKEDMKTTFTISGNGKQVRDVLHAKDMISLYHKSVQHFDRVCGQAFNIGGGQTNSLSLLELFAILNNELGITLCYTMLPPRESDQKVFVADITPISSLLRWKPEVSPEEGIRKMLQWVKEK